MKGGTSRAVQSPDYQTIYSAVIDTYTSNVTLRPWAEDEHMLQTAHIINIVNVFDRCTEVIVSIFTRASNEPSRSLKLYNHEELLQEGLYWGLLLVKSSYYCYHL